MNLKLSAENIEQDQPNENPKSNRKSVIMLGDSMIKQKERKKQKKQNQNAKVL